MTNLYMITAPIDKVHGDEHVIDAPEQISDAKAAELLTDGFIDLANINHPVWKNFEEHLWDDCYDPLDYANLIRLVIGGEESAAIDLAKHLLKRATDSFVPNNVDDIQEALSDEQD